MTRRPLRHWLRAYVPVEAAYWLDPEWQAWLRYYAGHPELSSLPTLDSFQGILALGAQPTP
jgi:hypothetical protein